MNTQPAPGNRNGKVEAPHFLNGASSHQRTQPRTVFPSDPQHADWRRPAYICDHFFVFGAPIRNYLTWALLLAAGLAALGILPGRWITAAVFLLLVLALHLFLRRQRRNDYVRFSAGSLPDIPPARLKAADKIPVHVTGHFSVEGKHKRFSQLPGFYRTFATGEHALLCLVRDRLIYRIGHWPQEDIGMWYIFFTPDLIQHVGWGALRFGPDRAPAVAVTYELTIPSDENNRTERVVAETVYLATETEDQAKRILADLLWELPATALPASRRSLATEQE